MARRTTKKKDLTPEEKLAQALVPVEEQPYEVPGNWCWVRLHHLLEPSKRKTEDFSDLSIKYVGLEHMEKDGGIVSFGFTNELKSTKNIFTTGQLLYGKLRPYLNKHGIAQFDGVCSTDILVFSARKSTTAPFVNYFFDQQFFLDYVISNSKGINLPRVSETVVLKAICPLPPLPEQLRIVARIESLFAKLDEAKEKAQAVVDGFEERKAAILHKAFTGELTRKWRVENKIKTTEWNKDNLANIASVVSGYAFSSSDFISSNPIPCIKITNVGVGEFIAENYQYLPDSFIADYAKFVVKKGDILISLTRSFIASGLKVCIYPSDSIALLNQRVALIRNCNVGYVYYYLRSDEALNYVKSRSKTTNQPNLSIKDLKEMIIPLAAEEEQIEIVRILDQFFLSEEKAMDATEQVLDQIDTMKKAILARAFRGELGTNDPQEESAVELVRRALDE